MWAAGYGSFMGLWALGQSNERVLAMERRIKHRDISNTPVQVNRTDEPEFVTHRPLFKFIQEKFDSMDSEDASEAVSDLKDIIDSVS